jgi:hypothetical protein
MMDRRRGLMGANQWEELPFDKTQFNVSDSKITATYNSQTDTISLLGKRAAAWVSTDAPFFTEEGYDYLIVSNYNTTEGIAAIAVRNSNFRSLFYSPTIAAPASGKFRVTFSHRSDIAMIGLFISVATSAKGNASYSELKIYRRKAS